MSAAAVPRLVNLNVPTLSAAASPTTTVAPTNCADAGAVAVPLRRAQVVNGAAIAVVATSTRKSP